MIVINELRITPDGEYMIIDVSIGSLNWYKYMYIGRIIIDTGKTYNPSGPSSKAIEVASYNKAEKNVRLMIKAKDLELDSLDEDIFFVYIEAQGVPDPDTPCTLDENIGLGVVYNVRPIYNIGMSYVRELSSMCDIPKGFIDYILRYNALELALRTGHYTEAIKYWDRFFSKRLPDIPRYKGCGCNGADI